jgi:hypothetical protein
MRSAPNSLTRSHAAMWPARDPWDDERRAAVERDVATEHEPALRYPHHRVIRGVRGPDVVQLELEVIDVNIEPVGERREGRHDVDVPEFGRGEELLGVPPAAQGLLSARKTSSIQRWLAAHLSRSIAGRSGHLCRRESARARSGKSKFFNIPNGPWFSLAKPMPAPWTTPRTVGVAPRAGESSPEAGHSLWRLQTGCIVILAGRSRLVWPPGRRPS